MLFRSPADGAPHVVVQFTGVELTGNGGNPVTITFSSPKSIDLVTQSGTASAELFDQPISPGSYGQVRLMVNADGNANDSYIILADGSMHGLIIPSGDQTGLKLVSGFTVPSSGVVDVPDAYDSSMGQLLLVTKETNGCCACTAPLARGPPAPARRARA